MVFSLLSIVLISTKINSFSLLLKLLILTKINGFWFIIDIIDNNYSL